MITRVLSYSRLITHGCANLEGQEIMSMIQTKTLGWSLTKVSSEIST